jgi:hypothetical protein
MSPSTADLPKIDPKAKAKELNAQIGTALAQGGSVDWSVSVALAKALTALGAPADDPMGACRYISNGTPVCAEMRQSECGHIGGSFTPGGSC